MIVVDASVWISGLAPDDVNHVRSQEWFAALPDGEELIEPRLLLVEVSATIGRRTGDLWLAERAENSVRENPSVVLHSMSDEFIDTAAALAARLRLRAGDAIYVALAHLTGARLVTWDREQRERASALITATSPDDDLNDDV